MLTSILPLFSFFQLSVRGKNKKEKLEDFFKNMVKSADGVIVSGVKVKFISASWKYILLFLFHCVALVGPELTERHPPVLLKF